MKVIILYEQKQYSCEMKQNFFPEDIIYNMRKILGDKETQKYILCDINGRNIENYHMFNAFSQNSITLILMKIPTFNPDEPLFNDNIKDDIANVADDPKSLFDILQKTPINHGNPEKKREPCQELIANIYGSFKDLPDLEKETLKRK